MFWLRSASPAEEEPSRGPFDGAVERAQMMAVERALVFASAASAASASAAAPLIIPLAVPSARYPESDPVNRVQVRIWIWLQGHWMVYAWDLCWNSATTF